MASDLQLTAIAGSVLACSPILARCQKGPVVLFATGSTIKCICTTSGALLGAYDGHAEAIVSIKVGGHMGERSSTIASLDRSGALHFWSIDTFVACFKFVSRASPVDFFMLIDTASQGDVIASTQVFMVYTNDSKRCELRPFDLSKQELAEPVALASSRFMLNVMSLPISGHQSVSVVVSAKRSQLTLVLLPAMKSVSIDIGDEISCVEHSKFGGLLAAGTKRGKIELFRDLSALVTALWKSNDKEMSSTKASKSIMRSTFHWHAHTVRTLSFSASGDMLYSSGDEAVLVFWSMSRNNNGSPVRFLPRVGAPIISIYAGSEGSNANILFSTRDNSIRVISPANAEVVWSWQSLDIPVGKSDGMIFQSFSGAESKAQAKLLSNACAGTLQMYNVGTKTLDSQLKVVNYVRVESGLRTYPPQVIHYATCLDGARGYMLATVDEQRGEEVETYQSLKFWQGSVNDGETAGEKPVLVSQVNSPHGQSPITCLTMRAHHPSSSSPTSILACSSSNNGFVKVWRCCAVQDSDASGSGDGPKMSWRCAYSLLVREGPVHALALSSDLSLLLVATQNVVSLWDPRTATKLDSIILPGHAPVIAVKLVEPREQSTLGGGNGNAFCAIFTECELAVYDLLSLRLMWSYRFDRVRHVCVAESEDAVLRFDETLAARSSVEQEGWIVVNAYVEEEKLDKIFVFSPLSAKPITSFSSKHHSHIQACALVPRFGLLFACDGALYSLSTLTNARNNQPMVARVKHSKLPAVSLSSVEKVQEKSDSHVLSAEESRSLSHSRQEVVPTTLAQSGKRLLSSLLAEHTQDLAQPSMVSADFIISVLGKANTTESSSRDPSEKRHNLPSHTADKHSSEEEKVDAPVATMDSIQTVLEQRLSSLFAQTSTTKPSIRTARGRDTKNQSSNSSTLPTTAAAVAPPTPSSTQSTPLIVRRTRSSSRLEEDSAAEDSESQTEKSTRKRTKRL